MAAQGSSEILQGLGKRKQTVPQTAPAHLIKAP